MKVAVTGHTRGIGLEIAEYFKSTGAEIIGFSKSTGYDISDPEVRNKIVEEVRGCEVFVNNAYVSDSANSQLELLKLIKSSWMGKNRLIINVSSRAGDSVNDPECPWPGYAKQKHEQDLFCQIPSMYPWILNLKPGTVNTDMAKGRVVAKMPVSTISKVLSMVLDNSKYFKIKSITFTLK
jgi:NAD(P)-dependent dehydrogenase (short-subunit alcohol dehydrogenase family)